MKKFKPKFHDIVYIFIPENTDDIFINEKTLEHYRTSETSWDRHGYEELISALGKTAFVFDVKACEFMEEK